MIYYTSLSPDLRRPRSHSRLSSVSMNTDIGHRLRPIAFAIWASPSFFFFPPSAADAPCLACSRAAADKAKVTGCIFPFVCLFVSSSLSVPPNLSKSCCHTTPFHPPHPPNHRVTAAGAVREGYALTGKQTAGSTAAPPERKNVSLASQNGGFVSCSLTASSEHGGQLPSNANSTWRWQTACGSQGGDHLPSAQRGQKEEDDFSRHLMDFTAAAFDFYFLVVSCWHWCNWGRGGQMSVVMMPLLQHTQRDVHLHRGRIQSHSNAVEDGWIALVEWVLLCRK